MIPGSSPSISVIVAAYSMLRWDALRAAVASVQEQTITVKETIVVVDHNPQLLAKARSELLGAMVIPNRGRRGASAARNTGVAACQGELVAFLDDDAIAGRSWLETLIRHYTDARVVGVGGRLDPLWVTARPSWFPPEFDWAVGASYLGMPESATSVRNVWSNNMTIRREVFDKIGGFRADLTKVDARSRPEDTDLCLRAAASQVDGTWIYEPLATAGHLAPAERTTIRYFTYRCFNEGWGKAALALLNGIGRSTATERTYAGRVLPAAFVRGFREACHGDASGGLRSLAILTGLTVATIGFLAAHVTLYMRRAFLGQWKSDVVTMKARS